MQRAYDCDSAETAVSPKLDLMATPLILKPGEDPPAARAVKAVKDEDIDGCESEASHGAPLK